jgi:SNF2 family DNA or RNA helicase
MGCGKTLMCLALIRSTMHHKTQPPGESETLSTLGPYHLPYYHADLSTTSRRGSRLQSTATELMYLSNATLVVVPSILMPQWKEEIEKHLIAEEVTVKILQGKTELWEFEQLPMQTLVKYDVCQSLYTITP